MESRLDALAKLLEKQKAGKPQTARSVPLKPNTQQKPIPQPPRDQKPSKYSDLDKLDLTVARQAGNWKDENFYSVRVYDVNQLDDDTAVLYGERVVRDIHEQSITTDTVSMMLHLAISLRSTTDIDEYLMADISEKMRNKITIPDPNMDKDEGQDGDEEAQLEILAKLFTHKKKSSEEERLNNKLQSKHLHDDEAPTATNKTASAAAYSYMAAFLMRLQCREPTRLVDNFETAKNRFSGFYDDGRETLEDIVLREESLQKIKEIIARKPEVTSTWVAWAAYSENECNLAKQDRGLLEYLALQVFAYQGMHVVVQILSIHEITKYPLGGLLKELDCRMTRSAVQEVYKIIKDYHKNSAHPERKHYFRYARVWDEGYFARVQSKHCAQLLYVAATTVKELGTNANSDPTQIYVIRNMSEVMKAQLDAVAAKLIELVTVSNEDDDEAGQIWKK